jgi:hypothetical protein
MSHFVHLRAPRRVARRDQRLRCIWGSLYLRGGVNLRAFLDFTAPGIVSAPSRRIQERPRENILKQSCCARCATTRIHAEDPINLFRYDFVVAHVSMACGRDAASPSE